MEVVMVELARQIPLALLFAGFAYLLMREMDTRQQARDEAFRSALAEQLKLMREFWNAQQDTTRDVLERLVSGVEGMMDRLERHDEKTDLAITAMFERTKDDPPEGLNVPTKPRRGGHD